MHPGHELNLTFSICSVFKYPCTNTTTTNARFEVFIVVRVQVKVFWVMTLCNTTQHHSLDLDLTTTTNFQNLSSVEVQHH